MSGKLTHRGVAPLGAELAVALTHLVDRCVSELPSILTECKEGAVGTFTETPDQIATAAMILAELSENVHD